MLRTLIVGLGRSGLGLHLPVLSRLAASPDGSGLFAPGPVIGYDPSPAARELAQRQGMKVVPHLDAACDILVPSETVVHVCTPSVIRLGILQDLVRLGFRQILVEKPLATDRASLADIEQIRAESGLQLVIVAQWLRGALTSRLLELIDSGELGALRSIHFAQLKPRFRRALADSTSLSAFDIEVPHSLGVALRLAGNAELVDARWSDLELNGETVPHMGTAHMFLRHENGVQTEIFSDLTAPIRERRIQLQFDKGTVTGHYPVSADDGYAQLEITPTGQPMARTVMHDDPLGRFLLDTYRGFASNDPTGTVYAINARAAALLCEAKERCSMPIAAVTVASEDTVHVRYEDLREFTVQVFASRGVPEESAEAAAEALIHGDLTGMSSHGVTNLGRLYLPLLDSGRVDPKATPDIVADRGAAVLLDANRSLGLWSASHAMDLAVERARLHGIGLVSVRNGTHFGCAGYHAAIAVPHQMIGIVAANCGRQRIARPPGGRVPMLGTNPLAVAAPAGDNPPFVLDMSTTVVPTGRVRQAARAGKAIPVGWLADDHGNPVLDPAAFDRGEAHLQWLGGRAETGAYKGYGLALMVEVLAALVPGAGLGPSNDNSPGSDDDIGFLTMAIAPAALRSATAFQLDADELFGALLACPPVRPEETVSYPGWREYVLADRARREGIALASSVYSELCAIADRLDIPAPRPHLERANDALSRLGR
jgi:LDH2 family malate/lactate/ureidoglycolate dehydrogenase/predicted dehydrogenase